MCHVGNRRAANDANALMSSLQFVHLPLVRTPSRRMTAFALPRTVSGGVAFGRITLSASYAAEPS
jgi:hypothetical protein